MNLHTSLIALGLLGVVCAVHVEASIHPLSDRFIGYINQISKTWKAGRNFPENKPLRDLKRLMGTFSDPEEVLAVKFQHAIPDDFYFPENFDARSNWNYCASIAEIRDQGACGSCWAISAAEVMTDRSCIHSQGKNTTNYSTQDIVSCCSYCGYGCDGGYPKRAFRYWKREGVVSGGPYDSSLGCYPYEISNNPLTGGTPECKQQCQKSYGKSYENDKKFGKDVVGLSNDEKNIMYEIITNGPVVGAFNVFEDFYTYKSGVYQHHAGGLTGGHAIRILGYGVEDEVPYWLCANSWNYNWGDQGFFKILRGSNECGIEDRIVAALPDL